ncbi:MAG: peptidoglycan-binding domain-containing protein [Azospirillaceae bacterium]
MRAWTAEIAGPGWRRIGPVLMALAATLMAGQAPAQPAPSGTGSWQAIDFATSADQPAWQDRPEVLQQTFGQELVLTDERFQFLDIGCAQPVLAGTVMAADHLLLSLAGATLPLTNYFGDPDSSVEIIEVDCLETGEVAMALTGDDMLILPYFGGYLVFDRIPSDRVRLVQERLAGLGLDVGTADGVYGGRTATAVQQLQGRLGIPATGAVSPFLISILTRAER